MKTWQDYAGHEAGLWPMGAQMAVTALIAKVEDLTKDKDRLDWLGYVGHGFVRGTDFSKWSIESPEEGIRVLRQAIDAVMERTT